MNSFVKVKSTLEALIVILVFSVYPRPTSPERVSHNPRSFACKVASSWLGITRPVQLGRDTVACRPGPSSNHTVNHTINRIEPVGRHKIPAIPSVGLV